MKEFFDSHAHLQHERFDKDRARVIESAVASGVSQIVNVGYDIKSSMDGIRLAEDYDFMYAAAGIHPHDAGLLNPDSLNELEQMADHEMVVAIGEIGLDYYRDLSPRDKQKVAFETQLELARSVDLPVVIHVREAHRDAIEILKEWGRGDGVMHCFSGSVDQARIYLELGFKLGFTGSITYGGKRLPSVAEKMPHTEILIETDCPYLVPRPKKGRNEPSYLSLVCDRVARARGISVGDCARMTTLNAKSLFRL